MKHIIISVLLLGLMVLVAGCTELQAPAPVAEPTALVVAEMAEVEVAEDSEPVIVATPATHNIVIENGRFMPVDAEVKVGDTVVWINKDNIRGDEEFADVRHSVTFDNWQVDASLPTGAIVSTTFTEPGVYMYSCRYHPGERGQVIVS